MVAHSGVIPVCDYWQAHNYVADYGWARIQEADFFFGGYYRWANIGVFLNRNGGGGSDRPGGPGRTGSDGHGGSHHYGGIVASDFKWELAISTAGDIFGGI